MPVSRDVVMVATLSQAAAVAYPVRPGDGAAYTDRRGPTPIRRAGLVIDCYTGPGGRPLVDLLVYRPGGGERLYTAPAADVTRIGR